jgi:hypothetical protein
MLTSPDGILRLDPRAPVRVLLARVRKPAKPEEAP